MDDKTKVTDIVMEIERRFDGLTPQLQIAARYILGAPDDVALYSMRKIASRAGVKPATMIRLAAKLSFENYNDFRDKFRKRIASPSRGYAARARQMQLRNSKDEEGSLLTEMLEAERENVDLTFENISKDMINEAAKALLKAEKVYIVGLRKCYPIAFFFSYATKDFLKPSCLVQGGAGFFREEISEITDRDAVLVVAFDPYTRETVEAAMMAAGVGANIIAVTDSVVSPLAKNANQVFIAANRSPSFFRSLVGAMTIVQALVAEIVTHIGEDAVRILDQADKRRRANNVYWNN